MYSPYLYARQAELLALRAILKHTEIDSALPVIEPVREVTRDIVRCAGQYGESGKRLVVLLNPRQGELRENPSGRKNLRAALRPLFKRYPSLLPGFRIGPATSAAAVDRFLTRFHNRSVALLYQSPRLAAAKINQLSANPQVDFHICVGSSFPAALFSGLPRNKRIRTQDYFQKQKRNADYSGTEFFTDAHKRVPVRYVGFGDYACIGQDLSLTGGPAAAVALHAVFKHPTTQDVWVEHFVSADTQLGVGSVAAKFAQAVAKLVRAAKRRPAEFGWNSGLAAFEQCVKNGTFPNLMKAKQFQIQHHVSFMLDLVTRKI